MGPSPLFSSVSECTPAIYSVKYLTIVRYLTGTKIHKTARPQNDSAHRHALSTVLARPKPTPSNHIPITSFSSSAIAQKALPLYTMQ